MKTRWCLAAILALAGSRAAAHELACEKTVNGQRELVIDSYPATINWQITVKNTHPTSPSTVLSVSDPRLPGFQFSPAPPFDLGVGEETTATFPMTIQSYADCRALADGNQHVELPPDVVIDNVATVTWDIGQAQCTARIVCKPPSCDTETPPGGDGGCFQCIDIGYCTPCDGGSSDMTGADGGTTGGHETFNTDSETFGGDDGGSGSGGGEGFGGDNMCTPSGNTPNAPPEIASRTEGFYKTHPDAVQACLAGGAVDVGGVKVNSVVEAMGLLWGSPNRFLRGQVRGDYDRARFLLEREVFAASCNERLFGTRVGDLVTQSLSALKGRDCADLQALSNQISLYSDSGDTRALPASFSPGDAAPRASRDRGIDPTTSTGRSCQ